MTIVLGLLVIAVGFAVGLMSAMFGVGGGVIMVPFIVLVLGESPHLAEGTSLLVIVPTAIAGVLVHRRSGYVDVRRSAIVAATGLVGAYLGARLALALDAEVLKVYFGVFTIVVGVRLLRDGTRAKRSSEA